MFPITTEETLIWGVETYWALLIKNFFNFLYGAIILIIPYLIVVLLLSNKALPYTRTVVNKIDNNGLLNKPQKLLVAEFVNHIQVFLAVILIVILILVVRVHANNIGTDLAKEKQQNFKSDDGPFKKTQLCYLDEFNQECTIETYPLQTSINFQAYFVGSDVLVLPTSRVLSIRYIGTTAVTDVNEKTAEQ